MSVAPLPKLAMEVRGLSRSYGAKRALHQVSFEVHQGECFGIIGPPGAGKTTLIEILSGLLQPGAGDVFACGLNLKTSRYQAKSLMGVVPAESGLDPDFTALDNLVLFAQCFGLSAKEARTRSLTLLRNLDVESAAEVLVRDLSPGVLRRLALARALVSRPQLLLLDELTKEMHPQERAISWEFLKNLKKEGGVSLVLASANLEEAQQLCERVAILHEGEILALGAPQDLILKNVGQEVVELACKEHEVRYFSTQLGGRFDLQVFKAGLRVYNADISQLRSYFSNLHVDALVIRKGTLQDVVLKLAKATDRTYMESEMPLL